LKTGTGTLTPEQFDLLFRNLPGEVTFVDENDVIVYYSDPKHRLFARSPEIIGRTVQSCHRGEGLAQLEKLLAEFRTGKRDASDSWKNVRGKSVHIRYIAVRDEDGTYRGALEVAQQEG